MDLPTPEAGQGFGGSAPADEGLEMSNVAAATSTRAVPVAGRATPPANDASDAIREVAPAEWSEPPPPQPTTGRVVEVDMD